jgi:hypothetical protein
VALTLSAAGLVLLSGCGHSSPGGTVPALKGSLVQVDDALAAKQWQVARGTLDELIREVSTARASGRITTDQADRIQFTAKVLRSQLPRAKHAQH